MIELQEYNQFFDTIELINRERNRLAQIGASYFITASGERPASTTAQAAKLLLIASRDGRDSQIPAMKDALMNDNDRLQWIKESAERAHKKRANGPIEVPMSEVVRIVGGTFAKAIDYEILSSSKLVNICDQMYPASRLVTYFDPEHSLTSAVNMMIDEASMQSGTQ